MTPDQIKALARKAGLMMGQHWNKANLSTNTAERFAHLVAQHERERCAAIVEKYTGAWSDEGFALAQAIRGKND